MRLTKNSNIAENGTKEDLLSFFKKVVGISPIDNLSLTASNIISESVNQSLDCKFIRRKASLLIIFGFELISFKSRVDGNKSLKR